MFLDLLDNSQKCLFLDLAIKAADSSSGISLPEKNMLKAFSIEMKIPAKYECKRSEDDILKDLKSISTNKELRIIMFEILGIMYSDLDFDDAEREFVQKIAAVFNIASSDIGKMDDLITRYSNLYSAICNFVLRN